MSDIGHPPLHQVCDIVEPDRLQPYGELCSLTGISPVMSRAPRLKVR